MLATQVRRHVQFLLIIASIFCLHTNIYSMNQECCESVNEEKNDIDLGDVINILYNDKDKNGEEQVRIEFTTATPRINMPQAQITFNSSALLTVDVNEGKKVDIQVNNVELNQDNGNKSEKTFVTFKKIFKRNSNHNCKSPASSPKNNVNVPKIANFIKSIKKTSLSDESNSRINIIVEEMLSPRQKNVKKIDESLNTDPDRDELKVIKRLKSWHGAKPSSKYNKDFRLVQEDQKEEASDDDNEKNETVDENNN